MKNIKKIKKREVDQPLNCGNTISGVNKVYGHKETNRRIGQIVCFSNGDDYLDDIEEDKLYDIYNENKHLLELDIRSAFIANIKGEEDSQYWDRAFHDLIHLEKNNQYLTEERLYKWAENAHLGTRFLNILIYLSVALDLPTTLNLNQSKYFEKYFGLQDYEVSKAVRNISTLLFLYYDVNHINELDNRDKLYEIGNENAHVTKCYAQVRKDYGDKRVIAVFNKCNQLVRDELTIRKVTGTLIARVNDDLTQKSSLNNLITDEVNDEYTDVKLTDLPQNNKEVSTGVLELNNLVNNKDKAKQIRETLKDYKEYIQEVSKNIDSYDSDDLREIRKSISNLYESAKSLIPK